MRVHRLVQLLCWCAGLTLVALQTQAAPVRQRLIANGPPARARTQVVVDESASCRDGGASGAESEFEFHIERESRVRLSVDAGDRRLSSRLEIVRDETEAIGCADPTTSTTDKVDWIGVLEPGEYSARVTLAGPTARAASFGLRLEAAPPPKVLYDQPLPRSKVHPLPAVGNTLRSDALLKLSCAEEGAPTELFELPISERSSFVFWIPPEIDDEKHVFAIVRATSKQREEVECGHQLSAILERGRYLLVAAAVDRKQVGSFLLPVTLRSVEAEERARRNALPLTIGSERSGSTRGRRDVFNFCDNRRVGHSAPDRVYRVEVPRAGELSLQVRTKGKYDGWLTIRDAQLDALDPERSDCTRLPGETLNVPVAPGTYYVIIDGIGLNRADSAGSFEGDFTISAALE